MSSISGPDIIMTMERDSQDYLGVYGKITIRADDSRVDEECGSLTFKTIELPGGTYSLEDPRPVQTYPYNTKNVTIKAPLETGDKTTSPRSLAPIYGVTIPPTYHGAKPADYKRALDSTLRISKPTDSIMCHAGRTSNDSTYCILIGYEYHNLTFPLRWLLPPQPPKQPSLITTRNYLYTQSFTGTDCWNAQVRMNLWFIKVEKILGRPPVMKYQRIGKNFNKEATGIVPQPVP